MDEHTDKQMMEAESDEDTFEFEIEIVSSSSSATLASNISEPKSPPTEPEEVLIGEKVGEIEQTSELELKKVQTITSDLLTSPTESQQQQQQQERQAQEIQSDEVDRGEEVVCSEGKSPTHEQPVDREQTQQVEQAEVGGLPEDTIEATENLQQAIPTIEEISVGEEATEQTANDLSVSQPTEDMQASTPSAEPAELAEISEPAKLAQPCEPAELAQPAQPAELADHANQADQAEAIKLESAQLVSELIEPPPTFQLIEELVCLAVPRESFDLHLDRPTEEDTQMVAEGANDIKDDVVEGAEVVVGNAYGPEETFEAAQESTEPSIISETTEPAEPTKVEILIEGGEALDEPLMAANDDELEWEFDHEETFEQREVDVKNGVNPREFYELGVELGKGKFGTVYQCVELASGRKLAAKFVHMRRKEDREDVQREVQIMSQLQHKRLLQLYDAFDDGKSEMCIITELVEGGELFERILDDDFELTERKGAIFVRQICEGVEYMHAKRIVHLDMKPENILCISKTGNRIKLIDFGLARRLGGKEPLRVMFGTPDFAAPEVLGYDAVSFATDMWSVGVICYVLLSGLSPFLGDNDMDTMANVMRATYDFDDEAFEPISELAKDFIARLLVKDQSERPSPSECLRHPWLQRGGARLEASVRERRRESLKPAMDNNSSDGQALKALEALADGASGQPSLVSLDKRNLKKYVVRRKWHKTVHAITALSRMGANLRLRLNAAG